MESIRIRIPNELFAPAESSRFEGTLDMPVMKAGPDLYSFDEPLSWWAEITNTGGALLVQGTVEGQAKTSCARCLEEVDVPLMGEIEGYFVIPSEDGGESEDEEEGEFDVLPDDNTIDLVPLMKAGLLLDIPLLPLCDDDCKGLCSTCGANLNEGPCGCEPIEEDPDFEIAKNPFAALKGFDFGDSQASDGAQANEADADGGESK